MIMKTYYKYFGTEERFSTLQDAKHSIQMLSVGDRRRIYNYNEGAVTIDKIDGEEVKTVTPVIFSEDFKEVRFGKTKKF